jgi:hypothetical protein
MIAVSEAEKKKDITARRNKNNNTMGIENRGCIYSLVI